MTSCTEPPFPPSKPTTDSNAAQRSVTHHNQSPASVSSKSNRQWRQPTSPKAVAAINAVSWSSPGHSSSAKPQNRQLQPPAKGAQQASTSSQTKASRFSPDHLGEEEEEHEDFFSVDLDQDFTLQSRASSKKATMKASYQLTPQLSNGSSRTSSASSSNALSSTYYQSAGYTRERFIRTNCKFFVLNNVTCPDAEKDPETLVSWDVIEYLQIQCSDEQICPICLGPPLAAKITRCGHVYCWVCILQHLSMTDKKWNNCPLCEDYVYEKDLRSIDFLLVEKLRVGSSLTFQLLKRRKQTTMPLLPLQYHTFSSLADHRSFNGDRLFFRVQHVSPEEVLNHVLDKEEAHLNSGEYEADNPFAERALAQCLVRREKLSKRASDLQAEPLTIATIAVTLAPEPTNADESQLFYQSSDGAPTFISSLDMRCLKHEFGSFELLPGQLVAPVISVERVTLGDEERSRFKFLSHLPYGCEISICDLDLSEVLSSSTTLKFADQLACRKSSLERKVREEKRLDIKARQAEKKREQDMISKFHELNSAPSTMSSSFENPSSLEGDDFFRISSPPSNVVVGSPSASFATVAEKGIMADEEENPTLLASLGAVSKSPVKAATKTPWGKPTVGSLPAAAPSTDDCPVMPSPSKKKNKKGTLLFSTSMRGGF